MERFGSWRCYSTHPSSRVTGSCPSFITGGNAAKSLMDQLAQLLRSSSRLPSQWPPNWRGLELKRKPLRDCFSDLLSMRSEPARSAYIGAEPCKMERQRRANFTWLCGLHRASPRHPLTRYSVPGAPQAALTGASGFAATARPAPARSRGIRPAGTRRGTSGPARLSGRR